MVLIGVTEENKWLRSSWNLTYRIGWNHICKGVHAIFDYYEHIEILVNGQPVEINNKDDILTIDENNNLMVRGISTIIKCPIMITFYNQLSRVDVSVPCINDEFKEADYQKFNMSLCQYLDSIELSMYEK